MGTYVIIAAIWIILGAFILDNFTEMDEDLAWWQETLCMLIITIAAPAIAISLVVDGILEFITGDSNETDF